MKKIISTLVFALFTLVSAPSFAEELQIENKFTAQCYVHFSPNGGALTEIVNRINLAQETVYLQAYNFTSIDIADALISAHRRGVKVVLNIDGKQLNGNGSKVRYTKEAGLEVYLDKKHAITHDKVIVIDGEWTHTGSFNFSVNAEKRNSENSVWCKSKKMAEVYVDHISKHIAHAELVN